MWTLQYVREVKNTIKGPLIENVNTTYTLVTKNELKDYVAHIFSIELDCDKNPIEPTVDIVKKYNLYNNSIDKIDSIVKFFKKNYDRYLDVIKETDDFEKEEYRYDIIDQSDRFYLDRLFNRYSEEYKYSYIIIKKLKEEEKGNGL